MSEIEVFEAPLNREQLAFTFDYKKEDNEHIDVKTVQHNGETSFVAIDVCRILDIKNPRSSLSLLDREDVNNKTLLEI